MNHIRLSSLRGAFAGAVVSLFALAAAADPCVRVPPQAFAEGGWKLDAEFMDVMGSPCLIAHGLGRVVCDATARVVLPEAGTWRVFVRAKNWLPADSAYPTEAADYPGSFRVLVNGEPLGKVFGRGAKKWAWEDGGTVTLATNALVVALRDLDGFDGRCAGLCFTKGAPLAPDAPALSVESEPVAARHAGFDLVVVGGGVPGCCAAVAAARRGLKVALVQDRPVLGGNSSSEIRVYSAGEQRHPIVRELRSLFLNRDANNAISDATRRAVLEREPNLSLFLGHRVFAAEKAGASIASVKALDLAQNRVVAFDGRFFCDATGDGWLGYYAGADFRQGREARAEFDESFAPETADRGTLGASLMWESSEADADVPFAAPWAEKYACGETAVNGEWNWEYGLDRDVIAEGEEVRDRLLLAIYGAFARAKREKGNARRVLTTCPFLLGKRESRRLMGDWIYRESDVTNRVPFADAVATGSWSIDLHSVIDPAKPFLTKCAQPHYGRYYIPYRALYSRNVANLFMAGRCFSCTHVGLGGPRVICTLAQMAVAVGTAAALCRERNLSPRGLYEQPGAMRELQRLLGGDWPGNPDPTRATWIVVDDEDAAASFGRGWIRLHNHNGGQWNDQTTRRALKITDAATPVYRFKSLPRGRYALKGLTPYAYSTAAWNLGTVRLTVVSDAGARQIDWNQTADSGDWADLATLELAGPVTIRVAPETVAGGRQILLDAFALVPRPKSDALDCVDPLIGTESAYPTDTQYGGMQPYTTVPFGSFHLVPMTRTNKISRLSYNSADKELLGFILTRQPAIWMGDWGEVRVHLPPSPITAIRPAPHRTDVETADGHRYSLAATAHAAWIRGLDPEIVAAFPESGVNTNRMDAKYGYPLPNFGGRWFADKSVPGELRIGLSLISVEQAKRNLSREIGARTFDQVVAATKAEWERLFSRIEIEAGEDVRRIFYTGLYHALLYPRQIDEEGRRYSAFDDRVHDGVGYTCYSLWDTYRAEHPLLTLVAPERIDGMMQSLVDMAKEGGWLPKWPNPSYTGIMIGAPAEVVLAEAWTKGFRGFDLHAAYAAARKNATVPQIGDATCDWRDRGQFGRTPETRGGLASYLERGYVACEPTRESVSRTQDFGLADCATAILADAAGDRLEAARLRARARNYTNLWCAAEGLFLPRRKDGSFVSRREIGTRYLDYCEQSPETGLWTVPFDTDGLVRLLGGRDVAVRRLDEYFDTQFWKAERGNKSIHGNEPSHHIAYLYNRFGAPEKTQRRVREILTRTYSTNRKGFDGNEDCGQMSAWFIFSALGFYPLDPASGEYELGSPYVESATLRFGAPYRPATLRIVARGASNPACWRVSRVTLNGRECVNRRVRHADLVAGGELVFEMSPAD